MNNVVIEYGPPGHKGVTAIQGIGAEDIEPDALRSSVRYVGGLSVVVWLGGMIIGSKTARNIGFGGALAAFGASMLANRQEKKQAGPAVAGW